MMDVIASGCSADSLGRSQILKSDYATDATSKGVRNYMKLCFERNAVISMVGCTRFCMVTDFWYIVVMPKNLAVRSPIMGCIHFCT